MLTYLQKRADFEDILSRTVENCPAFAAVLADVPTVAIRAKDRGRTTDGYASKVRKVQAEGGDTGGGSPDNHGQSSDSGVTSESADRG